MSRSEIALQPAPGPDLLELLPRVDVSGAYYRVHEERPGDGRGCWWFASAEKCAEPGGRFDLPAPRGTLYIAETRLAAALELCGRYLAYRAPIPVTAVEGRVVSQIAGDLTDLGDLTYKDAPMVGVTREISTLNDYAITASWAVGADELNFNGLRYYPRFSANSDAAYATFGSAGANAPAGLNIVSVDSLAKVLDEEGYSPRRLPSKDEAADDADDNIESR